ncbi:MAG: DNA polymerase III subunit chi [Ectothiorhodospiraceae bacterium AqS1]|nr:DNA polymerase III subunit chi [Ectothiorhodospiraceae bacterium AqS1]
MPGKVDFHIRKQSGFETRELLACRLSEKAWRKGHRVLILASDRRAASRIDDRLWDFRDDSFVPHLTLEGETTGSEIPLLVPVVIGIPGQWRDGIDVLIPLVLDVPEEAKGAARIVEIIPADDNERQAGRRRYREYRRLGFSLETHS